MSTPNQSKLAKSKKAEKTLRKQESSFNLGFNSSLKSLSLKEYAWLLATYSNDFQPSGDSLEIERPKQEERFFSRPWSASLLKEATKLEAQSTLWDSLSSLQDVPSDYWFTAGRLSQEREQINVSACIQLEKLMGPKPFEESLSFSELEMYLQLLDKDKHREEVETRKHLTEEEILLSELSTLNLIRECEELEAKLPQGDLTIVREEEAEVVDLSLPVSLPSLVDEKPKWLVGKALEHEKKSEIPLASSLPSLFLANAMEAAKAKPPKSHLQPSPQWLQSISKAFSRWSITRFLSEEQMNNIVNPPHPEKIVPKELIQWNDPEEKWFYEYLPSINLFFDRFREKHLSTLVTTWEEPEYTFPITEIPTGESFDWSNALKRPIFMYEGISPLTIGSDLQEIASLLDSFEKQYKEQSVKDFDESGLAIPIEGLTNESIKKDMQEQEEELL
ncbi:hypothetical protein MHLP_00200 [Candidatus Mycoplasma haematolamae str. Purdue]|uniref:Uncharacterized protein n=1 Tax=Mycoplasma haematolamae (strain Purdue) TaxID=1212765 RepID=I7B8R5_MYCHA|nr:hypothetical protein [Candidatus Mycoplasma haematolamae]AFO51620.1 hypothetical protein MHLP_00200 [Candidatus Mycoplasma haematolamae str. Purdue]